MTSATAPDAEQMDRIYRYQRYIYDATRRHFLLGRDMLIAGLVPPDGEVVVEIGCGTARNLIETAKAYPNARLFGLDISAAMLATAESKIAAAGLSHRIRVVQGDARNFDLQRLFGVDRANRVMASYTLSMIPHWQEAISCACTQLASTGQVHVVDFGPMHELPAITRVVLHAWLAKFSVQPNARLERDLRLEASSRGMEAFVAHPYRSYSTYAVLKRQL